MIILEGGKTVHTKNWWIILWQMPKIAKAPKIIIMPQLHTDRPYFHAGVLSLAVQLSTSAYTASDKGPV